MKDDIDAYKKGSYYEAFIHRAFRSSDTSKPGMHGSIIQNLIRVENGDTSFVKWHGSFNEQLEIIKGYMHKAMDQFMTMKEIPSENRDKLWILKNEIDNAGSSDDLMAIIYDAIELI